MTQRPVDQREYNVRLIEEFRSAGRSLDGRPLLLLTTTGAKTGQPRTTPMMYVRVGDRLLVVASNAGAPGHPHWYRNLVADPTVTVEADGERYAARARPVQGADRERLWAEIAERYPFFVDHQAKAERTIPVVELVAS